MSGPRRAGGDVVEPGRHVGGTDGAGPVVEVLRPSPSVTITASGTVAPGGPPGPDRRARSTRLGPPGPVGRQTGPTSPPVAPGPPALTVVPPAPRLLLPGLLRPSTLDDGAGRPPSPGPGRFLGPSPRPVEAPGHGRTPTVVRPGRDGGPPARRQELRRGTPHTGPEVGARGRRPGRDVGGPGPGRPVPDDAHPGRPAAPLPGAPLTHGVKEDTRKAPVSPVPCGPQTLSLCSPPKRW